MKTRYTLSVLGLCLAGLACGCASNTTSNSKPMPAMDLTPPPMVTRVYSVRPLAAALAEGPGPMAMAGGGQGLMRELNVDGGRIQVRIERQDNGPDGQHRDGAMRGRNDGNPPPPPNNGPGNGPNGPKPQAGKAPANAGPDGRMGPRAMVVRRALLGRMGGLGMMMRGRAMRGQNVEQQIINVIAATIDPGSWKFVSGRQHRRHGHMMKNPAGEKAQKGNADKDRQAKQEREHHERGMRFGRIDRVASLLVITTTAENQKLIENLLMDMQHAADEAKAKAGPGVELRGTLNLDLGSDGNMRWMTDGRGDGRANGRGDGHGGPAMHTRPTTRPSR